ncbi:MAG: class I SAM-dependent methyltransferase [Treponema sp.]|jgi:ubiquinone/menaquinone biosynthesis C-methylase UbiE|nr:class I SAM-dependent methyltransferase [Treponema sp.]
MSFNWINPELYSINTLLLMDKWIIEYFLGMGKTTVGHYSNNEYRNHLGIVLAYNPAIQWYFCEKCPETRERIKELVKNVPEKLTEDAVRKSEMYILDAKDSFVVYVYPEIMEELDYIKYWKPETLLSMVDFHNKVVLDIGSGTGRLAFAVVKEAKEIYAIDPVDRLREYLRQKRNRLGIKNMRISDGTIEEIPFPDNSFDIVMSGHVMGDDLNEEMEEMTRVVKDGGYIITCIGEDDRRKELDKDMIRLGFEHIYYKSVMGGDIYNYKKKIIK